MALVAYDYDSGSDTAEEEDDSAKVVIPSKSESIFSQLPTSKHTTTEIVEDRLEDFIPTVKTLKEKKKVQITIPSLSEFDDISQDEPLRKKVKQSEKGSGLLGLLPPVQTAPVRTSTMFIPNTVKKKTVPPKKKVVPPAKPTATTVKRQSAGSDSDTDAEDIEIPETFDDQMWEKVCGRPKAKPKPKPTIEPLVLPPPEEITIAPEPEAPYDGLDNVAFKELMGSLKRPIGNIKMIDINEEEIIPDSDLWLARSLTDPEMAPKKKKETVEDQTKRKKHHITYMAEQAKANEQELKSNWASSRNNRMMSRAKYGF